MTLRVGELLARPHLQIELVAGEAGIDRRITWAHASDLADPWDWLAGGELLMKNGRSLPRSAQGQVAFLEGLAAAEVTALVIGNDPMTPPLARRAVRRADELALPVLRIPYSMSFIAVTRAVADAAVEEQSRRMVRIERIYATLRARPPGATPGSFVSRLERELGHRVHLVDAATLRPVLGTKALAPEVLHLLAAALATRTTEVPAVVHLPDRSRRAAVAISVPFDEPTLLVAERSDRRGFDLSTLHHAAAAAAVEAAHHALVEDLNAQAEAAELAELLGHRRSPGRPDAPAGWRSSVATARLAAAPMSDALRQRRLALGLRRRGVTHIMVAEHDTLWVLLDGADPGSPVIDVVRARLGEGAVIGISDPVGVPTRMPEAAREARFARGIASQRGAGVAYFGETGRLPAVQDPAAARAVVEGVLGAVLAYDAAHGTDLFVSLEAFLEHKRSWNRTASALRVHRQTVIYRMKRVAALTGRDVSETSDLAELWLAVSAHRLLTDGASGLGPRRRAEDGRGSLSYS